MMNSTTFALVFVAVVLAVTAVQGFAPAASQGGRTGTQLQKSIFDAISDMDLWAPDKDSNEYGARNKKKLSIGEIKKGKSYVPDGLTASEYSNIRKKQQKSKDDNYKRNVAKAGVFEDYTEFYTKRGTDADMEWAKNKNTLGHRFAKTKYDWAGTKGTNFGTTTADQTKDKKLQAKKKRGKFSFGKK
mmetsp:Transcript_28450/g.28804  ORF Transcript_28450/g.28804 Transcript_28450/m.28804 type:complete len:187 (-) Transcript_28450:351-911(-)